MIKNLFFYLRMALIALALCIGVPGGVVNAQGIVWSPYSEGMSRAKQEGKKMMLFFYADWCDACKKMKKETFTDPLVISYLNKNFIAVQLNVDMARDIAKKYGVRWLPLTCFADPEGEKISSRPGYVAADEMPLLLKYVQTNSYKQMSYPRFLKQE